MNLRGKILVFGANGQVGSALKKLLGEQAIALSSSEADFSKPESIQALLASFSSTPKAIINAAAYTQVDKAEQEESLAFTINAESPALIAAYAAAHSIPFIHYSTDYVFPGTGHTPLKETESVSPLNAYGRTKLQGEEKIAAIGGKWLLFRTAWVYDEKGKNFLTTMLRFGKERELMRVVNDQFGSPTYAVDLAKRTIEALEYAESLPSFPSGIYHLCGSGATNWYEFAAEIFRQAREIGIVLAINTLEPIPSSAYLTPAKRPQNSQMDCSKAKEKLGITMPDWKESLADCLKHYK